MFDIISFIVTVSIIFLSFCALYENRKVIDPVFRCLLTIIGCLLIIGFGAFCMFNTFSYIIDKF